MDSQALLMPLSAPYGRAINGVSFQREALMTRGKYQYTAWYHLGSRNENVYIARRDLSANGPWQVLDTGKNFDNGDAPAWDAHNVISLGIDGNGKMHLSWDLHQHRLRYMTTADGAATGETWAASLFDGEAKTLPGSGIAAAAPFNEVTYPQFITKANGDMIMTFRHHNSGNGDMYMGTYSAATKTWDAPHEIIDGTHNALPYNDAFGNGANSTLRNGYINGIDVAPDGRLQMTWTWRESTGGSNHNINYAYSDDNGVTWRNNAGVVVGTVGSPMNLKSESIAIKTLDRGNTLMNQQAQAVDSHGTLHTVMWHKRDDQSPVRGFTTAPAGYYDYYRDPSTAVWHRNPLPLERAVGSRADIGFDKEDTLYAAYISAGTGDGAGMQNYYTDGDLVISKATAAGGYADWTIIYVNSTHNWIGEPRLDQTRLLKDGVLSIFLQENSADPAAVGTPLHVLELDIRKPAS